MKEIFGEGLETERLQPEGGVFALEELLGVRNFIVDQTRDFIRLVGMLGRRESRLERSLDSNLSKDCRSAGGLRGNHFSCFIHDDLYRDLTCHS